MLQNMKSNMKKVLDEVLYYIWLGLTGLSFFIFFRILNRTVVKGKENIPRGKRILFLSNHRTMIDSFLIGTEACFPRCILEPSILPYSPAASENFFSNPVLGFMSKNWKCIPVDRQRNDLAALRTIIKNLKDSNVILFPEGTRSRDGELGEGKNGVGMIIREADPIVIPVYIDGMEKVLPIGKWNPRIGKKVTLMFGKPLDFSDCLNSKKRRESIIKITDRVMGGIKELESEHREVDGFYGQQQRVSHGSLN